MLTATGLFVATWFAQLDGYKHDEAKTLGWILGLGAEGVLAFGGYLGGRVGEGKSPVDFPRREGER